MIRLALLHGMSNLSDICIAAAALSDVNSRAAGVQFSRAGEFSGLAPLPTPSEFLAFLSVVYPRCAARRAHKEFLIIIAMKTFSFVL